MQQRVAHQIRHLVQRFVFQQIGRAHRRQTLLEQGHRLHVHARRRAIDDRRIERLELEVDVVLPGGGDLHVQLGILGLEAHDLRQHPAHHAGRHFQCEIGALTREAQRYLLDTREALLHCRQQQFAFGGQRETFCMAFEERELVIVLERDDLPAHRALRQA
jgi:hypothetical protein